MMCNVFNLISLQYSWSCTRIKLNEHGQVIVLAIFSYLCVYNFELYPIFPVNIFIFQVHLFRMGADLMSVYHFAKVISVRYGSQFRRKSEKP